MPPLGPAGAMGMSDFYVNVQIAPLTLRILHACESFISFIVVHKIVSQNDKIVLIFRVFQPHTIPECGLINHNAETSIT